MIQNGLFLLLRLFFWYCWVFKNWGCSCLHLGPICSWALWKRTCVVDLKHDLRKRSEGVGRWRQGGAKPTSGCVMGAPCHKDLSEGQETEAIIHLSSLAQTSSTFSSSTGEGLVPWKHTGRQRICAQSMLGSTLGSTPVGGAGLSMGRKWAGIQPQRGFSWSHGELWIGAGSAELSWVGWKGWYCKAWVSFSHGCLVSRGGEIPLSEAAEGNCKRWLRAETYQLG